MIPYKGVVRTINVPSYVMSLRASEQLQGQESQNMKIIS